MTPKQEAALRMAREALKLNCSSQTESPATKALSAIDEALAEQPAQQQEPVSDALHFAQWTAAKKDLSDYILVGSLSLAGIEDGEYGTSEIDPFDNTIEALQEKLVTGSDHKKVPLLAYIGAWNNTSPQPAQPSKPLTDEQEYEAIGTAGNDLLELAKRWADNEVHVYQFDNEARKIIKAVLHRAHAKGDA